MSRYYRDFSSSKPMSRDIDVLCYVSGYFGTFVLQVSWLVSILLKVNYCYPAFMIADLYFNFNVVYFLNFSISFQFSSIQ